MVKRVGRRGKAPSLKRPASGDALCLWVMAAREMPEPGPRWPGMQVIVAQVLPVADDALLGRVFLPAPWDSGVLAAPLDELLRTPGWRKPSVLVVHGSTLRSKVRAWAARNGIPVDDSPPVEALAELIAFTDEDDDHVPWASVYPGAERSVCAAVQRLVSLARRFQSSLPVEFEVSGEGVSPEHRFCVVHVSPDGACQLLLAPALDALLSLMGGRSPTSEAAADDAPSSGAVRLHTVSFDRIDTLLPAYARTLMHRAGCSLSDAYPRTLAVMSDRSVRTVSDSDVVLSSGLVLEAIALVMGQAAAVTGGIDVLPTDALVRGRAISVTRVPLDRIHGGPWACDYLARLFFDGSGLLARSGDTCAVAGPTPLVLFRMWSPADVQAAASGPGPVAVLAEDEEAFVVLESGALLRMPMSAAARPYVQPGGLMGFALELGRRATPDDAPDVRRIERSVTLPILRGPASRYADTEELVHVASGFRREFAAKPPARLWPVASPHHAFLSYFDQSWATKVRGWGTLFAGLQPSQLPHVPAIAYAGVGVASMQDSRLGPGAGLFALRALATAGGLDLWLLGSYSMDGFTNPRQRREIPEAQLTCGLWQEDDAFVPLSSEGTPLAAIPRKRQAQPERFVPGPGLALVCSLPKGDTILDGLRVDREHWERLRDLETRKPWRSLPEQSHAPFRALFLLDALTRDTHAPAYPRGGKVEGWVRQLWLEDTDVLGVTSNPLLEDVVSLTMEELAACTVSPDEQVLLRLMIRNVGRLCYATFRDSLCPPGELMEEMVAQAVGCLPSGDRHPDVLADFDGDPSQASPWRLAVHHVRWLASKRRSPLGDLCLQLRIAQRLGLLDEGRPLEVLVGPKEKAALKRLATALHVPASELSLRHLPSSVRRWHSLPNVGFVTIEAMKALGQRALDALAVSPTPRLAASHVRDALSDLMDELTSLVGGED